MLRDQVGPQMPRGHNYRPRTGDQSSLPLAGMRAGGNDIRHEVLCRFLSKAEVANNKNVFRVYFEKNRALILPLAITSIIAIRSHA